MEPNGASRWRGGCNRLISWSGRRDSNPRRPAWENGHMFCFSVTRVRQDIGPITVICSITWKLECFAPWWYREPRAEFYRYTAQARPALLLCGAVVVGLLSSFCTPAARAQASAPQPSGKATATLPGLEPPVKDNQIFAHVLLGQFEGRTNGPRAAMGWRGMDRH